MSLIREDVGVCCYGKGRCDNIQNTVEPPQNSKITLSLTGGGHLQESNHRGPIPRRGPR